MKKIIFSAIFSIACLISLAQENASKNLYLKKSFNDASFKKINAETSHGNIIVSSGTAAETRVEVYIGSSNSDEHLTKEEIQKKLDEYYSLDVSLSADVLNVVVRRKKEFINQTSLNISLRIYTTKDKSTVLRTSHGNIGLSGMNGSQDIVTSHGNISAEEITGKLMAQTSHGNVSVSESKNDVDIKTDHGNIDAKNCEGTVKLITSNGNIDLKTVKGKVHAGTDHGNIAGNNIDGSLSATTSHGDVVLENLTCSLDASTNHGNIALSFDKITGDIVADDSQGNISIQLPKGQHIDFDLRGKGVDMESLENFSGSKKKDEVKGNINGGGTKVSAKTDKGQVNVTFR